MKKIILSAIAIFTIGFANAQKAEFGIKGGVNIASLTGDVDGQSSLVGIQIGGFAEFKISNKFAIQPELLFSTQGVKFDTGESLNLSYFNIPVMAKYYAAQKLV